MKRFLLFSLMAFVLSVHAQNTIVGSIVDSDLQGIADVVISAPEYGLEARSDSNGIFSLTVGSITGIRNFSTQTSDLESDPNTNYRIIVPNGARRILPWNKLSSLSDGIYYLVPGRHYSAKQRIFVLNGHISAQKQIRDKPKSLRKVTATSTLNIVKANVVDTNLTVTPGEPVNLILPSTALNKTNSDTMNVISAGTRYANFTDPRDNQSYPTIQIGKLLWMATNLNYDTANGSGSWCPSKSASNCETYGRLYNWVTAMALPATYTSTLWNGDINNHQGICPSAWRIPNETDWENLELSIGMTQTQVDSLNWRGNGFGTAMKSENFWISGDHTNSIGFNAQPSGYYNSSQAGVPGAKAYFWTATEKGADIVHSRALLAAFPGINRSVHPKGLAGFAVRCVTDASGQTFSPNNSSSSQNESSSSPSNEVCPTYTPAPPESTWPQYCRTAGNCGTFIDDRNCQQYRWTMIGGTQWMAQNLNYGAMVTTANNQANDKLVEKYCYDNNDNLCQKYGALYQWHEAMGFPSKSDSTSKMSNSITAKLRGVCPLGWYLPTQEDWASLEVNNQAHATSLKSETDWSLNNNGNDEFGFSALPGGFRTPAEFSSNLYSQASWWLAEESFKDIAWSQQIRSFDSTSERIHSSKYTGHAIRCVKNTLHTWGSAKWEKWKGEFAIDSIPLSTPPDDQGHWSILEAPINIADSFAYRVRGYIRTPQDGFHTFWISADDVAELYLGEDSTSKIQIASSPSWTPSRNWNVYPEQKSAQIYLDHTKLYYIEIRLISTGGYDNMAIGWSKPGESTAQPSAIISGEYLVGH